MVAVKLSGFGGMQPALDDRLIPDAAASEAENVWLYSGALIGFPTPKLIHTGVIPSLGRTYRIPGSYDDPANLDEAVWLEFENVHTDVIRSAVVDDTFDRYYWASTTDVPRYATREMIEDGDDPWMLGVPAPSVAPSINVSGGSATPVARSYVYTWVTAYGEEGPPSPPTTVTDNPDGSWDLTLTAPDAADDGDPGDDRNITTVRIYRTVDDEFFFVVEQAVSDTTYSDTASDVDVSSNETLQSTNWSGPPEDLEGFVSMPNGMVAGWTGNELWFSEPFRPHAWPAQYTLAVEYPIVGIGVVNQTLVVCTRGFPMTATGIHPSTVTTSKLANFEPCVSRGSIVSIPAGVFYASPNGFIQVNPGQAINTTRNLITKDKWQSFTRLSQLRIALYSGAFYAFGSGRFGVFDFQAFDNDAFEQEDTTGGFFGLLLDLENERVAVSQLHNEDLITFNVYNDAWSGELYVIRDNNVYWIDQSDPLLPTDPYRWKSKIFQVGAKDSLGAMKVFFEVPDGQDVDLNPVRNTDLEQELQDDQYGLVRVYANDTLVLTRELRTSGELWKLPSGFKADFWQVEVEARVRVLNVQLASTTKELASV